MRRAVADFEVGLLHGQMPSREKSAAMAAFVAGSADVLVATTVIEVGIDVPNATVMLIEGAERYGLSQLHQLRGRIGRGEHESPVHPVRATRSPTLARRRMEAIAAAERDGFELAEVDLALRGEGEMLGTRQHGLPRFRVAVLPEDAALLAEARREALGLLRAPGRLDATRSSGPLLEAARERFGDERASRSRREGGRGQAAAAGGSARPRGARGSVAPDLRPRPRGAVLDARRRRRPAGPRPLLRHRGARDRGDLARCRLGRRSSTPDPALARAQRRGARDLEPVRGRARGRGPLPGPQPGAASA